MKAAPPLAAGLSVVLGLFLVLNGAARSDLPEAAASFSSPEDLARTVLDAIARKDREALEALALSEEEFRTAVWPELPASRPEANTPFEFVWGRLHQNSTGHLYQLLDRHGGRRYKLVRVEFQGETTVHDTFTVRRKPRVHVKDESGEFLELRLFGSLLERGGRYRLFSYVVS